MPVVTHRLDQEVEAVRYDVPVRDAVALAVQAGGEPDNPGMDDDHLVVGTGELAPGVATRDEPPSSPSMQRGNQQSSPSSARSTPGRGGHSPVTVVTPDDVHSKPSPVGA